MRVFYSPHYYADIGDTHIFPIRKFELVRDRLLGEGTFSHHEIIEPEPANIDDVRLVHTDDYVTRLCAGELTTKEIRRLGLPWSESLVRRSFYAVGGTISAAVTALETGFSSNLAGGTHHSFADRGEGFCVLNDVAVAIRTLRKRGLIQRAQSLIAMFIREMEQRQYLPMTLIHSHFLFMGQITIPSSRHHRRWILNYLMVFQTTSTS